MSGTLGNLAVVLTLNSTGFTLGMAAATKATGALQSAVGNLQNGISSTSAAFGTSGAQAAAWGSKLAQAAAAATTALQGQIAAQAAAAAAATQTGTAATASARAQQQATAATTASINAQTAAVRALRAAGASVGSGGTSSAGSLLGGLTLSSLLPIAGGLAGIASAATAARDVIDGMVAQIGAVIEAGDRMTIGVSRLQSVLGSTRTVAQETYNQLEASAAKTGIGVDELVKSFTGFDLALAGIGQSRQQIIDFTTTLTTLAHISGTTGAAANRAFRELSEGLATGAVNLRQLKIVAQDMPPLLGALASSLDVTTGQLEQMASSGKLTTDVVAAAISSLSGKVQAQFGQLPISLATARQDLATAADKLRADLDHALDLSSTMARWDQWWANFAQTVDKAFDHSKTAEYQEAQRELALLMQQRAKPATLTDMNSALYGTKPDTSGLDLLIAKQQAYVDGLKTQLTAQSAADNASAASALQQHQLAEATEAVSKAMETLGLSHDKTTPEIQTLTDAIARGQDVTVAYDGSVLHASQVLDLLREKATPAAQAIAALNEELVKANAANLGGAQSKLTDTLLAADPADKTGRGLNLSQQQRDSLEQQTNTLLAAQGQKDVAEAQNRLRLAQAAAAGRAANDHGLAEANERIRQTKAKFLQDHGNSPEATSEANQIASADTSAAQLAASAASVKAAQPGITVLTDLKAKVAELTSTLHGGGTAVAEWTAKLATASPSVKAQGAAILAYAAQVDQLTAAQKRAQESQEALQSLQANVARSIEDVDTAQIQIGDTKRSSLERSINDYVRTQAGLVRTAQLDTSNPARGAQAAQLANQASTTEAVALIQQQVDANNTAAETIRKSWDDTYTGRRTAALAEVQQESDALDRTIALYVTNADQKKKLTDETATYIAAKTQEAMRQTEGQTAKLARSWADTTNEMDTATASFASNFVDATVDSLNGGKSAWADFADNVIKQLEKIAVQAALSPLLQLVGSNDNSSGGLTGILGKLGSSLLPSIFGSGSNAAKIASSGDIMAAYGHHAGGMAGAEPTFIRNVPASLFNDAPRYHTGGIAGNEIPAILQQGEGVFTKGQMQALGAQGAAFASLSQMVGRIASARLAPPSSVASSPANYNFNPGPPGNVGAGGTSTGTSGAPPVTVNLHNQTGTAQTAVASAPKFDGEKMIIDIVTKHVNQPGALRSAIRK